MCVCVQPAANESAQKEYGGMEGRQRANLSSEKVVQTAMVFRLIRQGRGRR